MVKKITKILSAIFVALAVALPILMSISVAYATTPVQVTWTAIPTGLIVKDVKIAGNSDNVFLDLSLSALCIGDMSGTYTSDSHWIVQNWVTGTPLLNQPGPIYIHAIDYFTVTFDGKSGTLAILTNHVYYPSLKSSEGTWIIISGTGALSNLHGQGTTSMTGGPTIWTGQVHFDA